MATGAVAWREGPTGRVRWGAAAMAAAMVPLYFIDHLVPMGLLLLLAGCAIAPTLIAALSLTEQTVPRGRLTEGMAIMHTGLVAGVAPGATLSGLVIDGHGASAAYLVALGAGVVAAVAAQALPRTTVPAVHRTFVGPRLVWVNNGGARPAYERETTWRDATAASSRSSSLPGPLPSIGRRTSWSARSRWPRTSSRKH